MLYTTEDHSIDHVAMPRGGTIGTSAFYLLADAAVALADRFGGF